LPDTALPHRLDSREVVFADAQCGDGREILAAVHRGHPARLSGATELCEGVLVAASWLK